MWRIVLTGCLACALWTGPSMQTSLAASASKQASASTRAGNPYVASQAAFMFRRGYEIVHADYSHCPTGVKCPNSKIRFTSASWTSVSDGNGGTLYGWLVGTGGNYNGFWFVFFDDAQYAGRVAGGGTLYPVSPGKFGMNYKDHRANDPMCCPTGPAHTLIYKYNPVSRIVVLVSPVHRAPAVRNHPPAANPHAYTDRSTGMTLTINKAIKDYKGSGFSHPRNGYLFAALYITIRNGSGSNHSYNPFDLTLVDNRGQTFNPTAILPDAYSPSINSGTMPKHQFRAGWTGFEIPKSTKYVVVYWDDGYRLDPPAQVTRYSL
jgi:Domain of unknown function (DUF4352)